MAINIRDFIIKLGFDSSEVDKGIREIESRLGRVTASQTAQARQQTRTVTAQTRERKNQLTIERRRLALQRLINKATPTLRREFTPALRSNDPLLLQERAVRLSSILERSSNLQARDKQREAIAADRVAAIELKAAQVAKQRRADERVAATERRTAERRLAREANAIIANRRAEERASLAERAAGERRLAREANALIANRRAAEREERQRETLQRTRNSVAGAANRNRIASNNRLVDPANSQFADQRRSLDASFTDIARRAGLARNANDVARLRQELADLTQQASITAGANSRLTRTMRQQRFAVNSLRSSVDNLARSYLSVFAVIGGGTAAIRVGQGLIQVQASLLSASGSAEAAASNFQFIRSEALRLGVDLNETTRGFQQFGVSARAAGISTEEVRSLFSQVTEAAVSFGLSTDDTGGVFRAFSQTISRGVVSMEELRQQLGDRLPGSFQTAARSMGVTERELTRLVESGQLGSVEFLRNFIPALNQTARESGALEASLRTSRTAMNRFGTSLQLNVLGAFNAGTESGLFEFFNDLSSIVNGLAPNFRILGQVVGSTLQFIGDTLFAVIQPLRIFTTLFEGVFGSSQEQVRGLNGELLDTVTLADQIYGSFLILSGLLERIANRLQFSVDASVDEANAIAVADGRGSANFAERFNAIASNLAIGAATGLFDFFTGANTSTVTAPTRGSSNVANINITATDPTAVGEIVNQSIQDLLTVNMSTGN